MLELLAIVGTGFVAVGVVAWFAVRQKREARWRPPTVFHEGPVEPAWTEEIGRAGGLSLGRASRINDDAMLVDNKSIATHGSD